MKKSDLEKSGKIKTVGRWLKEVKIWKVENIKGKELGSWKICGKMGKNVETL